MLLQPKKTKFRKQQKGRLYGKANRGTSVVFGEYGLKATETGWLTQRQIESARRAITGHIKRGGKTWIRVFPDKPITRKPLEVRQGSGKGNVEFYVFPVKAGRIIYELEGVPESLARRAFELAAAKLPFKCVFVKRITL